MAQWTSNRPSSLYNSQFQNFQIRLERWLFMAALCNRASHYIFALWFLLSFYLLLSFSSPNLSRRRLDFCYTSHCGLSANLRCRSETCCTRLAEIQDAKKSGHHRTTLSDYIFATKAHIDNRKKYVKQEYLLYMSSQYGELQPTSGWDLFVSLGTPTNFNGFRVLAALLHGTLVMGVSQTLRRWTDGATYIWQGCHHVGHWPTLSLFLL